MAHLWPEPVSSCFRHSHFLLNSHKQQICCVLHTPQTTPVLSILQQSHICQSPYLLSTPSSKVQAPLSLHDCHVSVASEGVDRYIQLCIARYFLHSQAMAERQQRKHSFHFFADFLTKHYGGKMLIKSSRGWL